MFCILRYFSLVSKGQLIRRFLTPGGTDGRVAFCANIVTWGRIRCFFTTPSWRITAMPTVSIQVHLLHLQLGFTHSVILHMLQASMSRERAATMARFRLKFYRMASTKARFTSTLKHTLKMKWPRVLQFFSFKSAMLCWRDRGHRDKVPTTVTFREDGPFLDSR